MPEWRETTLGEVAHINPEATPKGWSERHMIRYVDIASVSDVGGIGLDGLTLMPFGEAPGRARRRIRAGDVLVSTVRPNLRAFAVVPSALDGEVASTGFAVVRADQSTVLPGFVWCLVASESFVDDMVRRCTGSNYPAIRAQDVASYRIALPPLDEQRRIVDVMAAVAVHVEALRAEIASLRALRASLLASVFPDEASTDEWVEAPFEAAIDFREGPGIMAVDFHDQGVPLIRLAGLTPGTSLLTKCNYLDPAKVDKKWEHFRVRVGDVLLSTSASLGRVAVVDAEAAGAVPYTGIIRMRPATDKLEAGFIPWILRSPRFAKQVEAAGVGTVMAHFGPSHLREMNVLVPPVGEQRRIAEFMEKVDDDEQALQSELDQIRHFRSTLLTSLLDQRVAIPASYDLRMNVVA